MSIKMSLNGEIKCAVKTVMIEIIKQKIQLYAIF